MDQQETNQENLKEFLRVVRWIKSESPIQQEQGDGRQDHRWRCFYHVLGKVVRSNCIHLVCLLAQEDRTLRLEDQDDVEHVAHKEDCAPEEDCSGEVE